MYKLVDFCFAVGDKQECVINGQYSQDDHSVVYVESPMSITLV